MSEQDDERLSAEIQKGVEAALEARDRKQQEAVNAAAAEKKRSEQKVAKGCATVILGLVAAVTLVVMLAPTPPDLILHAEAYGDQWPFEFSPIEVDCVLNRVTAGIPGKANFGINDTALAYGFPDGSFLLSKNASTEAGKQGLRRIQIRAQEERCSTAGREVEAKDFPKVWPFKTPAVHLDCTMNRVFVRIPHRGIYALNGNAAEYGYPRPDKLVLKKDPETGRLARTDWMIQGGLDWCERVEGDFE